MGPVGKAIEGAVGEDGVVEPSHFNDRLLLGLKGTMSEAELHVLRARRRFLQRRASGRSPTQIPPGRSFATSLPTRRGACDNAARTEPSGGYP